ncbi:26S proteasome subunit [Dirofilaria immitis]
MKPMERIAISSDPKRIAHKSLNNANNAELLEPLQYKDNLRKRRQFRSGAVAVTKQIISVFLVHNNDYRW